jgi:hypothetical protein
MARHSRHRPYCLRSATRACHSWPRAHSHQTTFALAGYTSKALSGLLRFMCHSAATSGNKSPKDCPGGGAARFAAPRFREQRGHPWPAVRIQTIESHSYEQSEHVQQNLVLLPGCTLSGVIPSFFSGSNSIAILGKSLARLLARYLYNASLAWCLPQSLGSRMYSGRRLAAYPMFSRARRTLMATDLIGSVGDTNTSCPPSAGSGSSRTRRTVQAADSSAAVWERSARAFRAWYTTRRTPLPAVGRAMRCQP